jgi:hypothetical protein
MTSEEGRLIGEVAPCLFPTTSSTLHLLLPLVPTPPPHTTIPSPREKSGSRTLGLSVCPLATLKGEWVTWFARAVVNSITCTGLQRGSSMLLRPGCDPASSAVRDASRKAADSLALRAATASASVEPACLPVLRSCQLPCSGMRRVPHHAARQSPCSAHVGSDRQCSAAGGPSYMTDRQTAESQQQNTVTLSSLQPLLRHSPLYVLRWAHVPGDAIPHWTAPPTS